MSSSIRTANETELDEMIERGSENTWRYERTDRARVVDSWVLYDVQPAVATIHKGRYMGNTDTEARVRAAIDAARAALKELSNALHADRLRRTRAWKAKHHVE